VASTSVGDVAGLRKSDQRPASSTLLTALKREWRPEPVSDSRFSCGSRSARNPSKLSEVTHPWAASSARACSTPVGRTPWTLASSSPKNMAPAARKGFEDKGCIR
jgi:hypothetical protein